MDRQTKLKQKERAREQRELSMKHSNFPTRFGGMTKQEQRSIVLGQVRSDFEKYGMAYNVEIQLNDRGKLVIRLEER